MIARACAAGARWVQLRIKDAPDAEVEAQAREALAVCREHGATLLINDRGQVAERVGADGVHVGQTDMRPAEARTILGPDKMIGGTANTWEHMAEHLAQGVDYIGLGPFRFTASKQKLSPILGLEGYTRLLAQMSEQAQPVPVIAIGGIQPADVAAIRQTGVHGVAIASHINTAADPQAVISSFNEALL